MRRTSACGRETRPVDLQIGRKSSEVYLQMSKEIAVWQILSSDVSRGVRNARESSQPINNKASMGKKFPRLTGDKPRQRPAGIIWHIGEISSHGVTKRCPDTGRICIFVGMSREALAVGLSRKFR